MFTVDDREALCRRLIEWAREDDRIVACALLGSAARGQADAWSDIVVALRLDEGSDLSRVVHEWTAWLSETTAVADMFDVQAHDALYRVFLCSNALQIDLSFWPHAKFRAVDGRPMRLVFGEQNPPEQPRERTPHTFIRMGWLYALHARSAIERGHQLQAEMMLACLRDQVVALACLRLGLDPEHGRDAHELPQGLTHALVLSRARHIDEFDLRGSLRATTELYLTEVGQHDALLAGSITSAVRSLAHSV